MLASPFLMGLLTANQRHWIAYQFNLQAGQPRLIAWLNAAREIREQDKRRG